MNSNYMPNENKHYLLVFLIYVRTFFFKAKLENCKTQGIKNTENQLLILDAWPKIVSAAVRHYCI